MHYSKRPRVDKRHSIPIYVKGRPTNPDRFRAQIQDTTNFIDRMMGLPSHVVLMNPNSFNAPPVYRESDKTHSMQPDNVVVGNTVDTTMNLLVDRGLEILNKIIAEKKTIDR